MLTLFKNIDSFIRVDKMCEMVKKKGTLFKLQKHFLKNWHSFQLSTYFWKSLMAIVEQSTKKISLWLLKQWKF